MTGHEHVKSCDPVTGVCDTTGDRAPITLEGVLGWADMPAEWGSGLPNGSCNAAIARTDGSGRVVVCGYPRREDGTCLDGHPAEPPSAVRQSTTAIGDAAFVRIAADTRRDVRELERIQGGRVQVVDLVDEVAALDRLREHLADGHLLAGKRFESGDRLEFDLPRPGPHPDPMHVDRERLIVEIGDDVIEPGATLELDEHGLLVGRPDPDAVADVVVELAHDADALEQLADAADADRPVDREWQVRALAAHLAAYDVHGDEPEAWERTARSALEWMDDQP